MMVSLLTMISITVNILHPSLARYTVVLIQGDPGLPGGDPDLPDTPIDGGVYVLVALALIYGYQKLRTTKDQQVRP